MRYIHRKANCKNKPNKPNKLTLEEEKTLDHIIYGFVGISVFVTLISGTVLFSSNFTTHADNTSSSNVSVNVANSCTMAGSGMDSHNATLVNGTYRTGIGTTTLTVYCNDPDGFTVYAIGVGESSKGVNYLDSSLGDDYDIPTGLNTDTSHADGNSNWAMLVNKVTGTYQADILNSFDSYHEVPANYTAIAKRESGTDVPNGSLPTVGSQLTTTYAAYIATTQPAGTYTGKVKYAMIHPHTNETIRTLEQALANASSPTATVGGKTYYTMQGLTSSICSAATIIGTDSTIQMVDTRDNKLYYVTKLQDGNCWMLDNLRLDLTAVSLTDLQGKTNASNTTLGYLKNGGGSGGNTDQYPQYGVVNGTDNTTWTNSYNNPYINNTYVDTPTTKYGNGSGKIGIYYNYCAASAGSYCYGSGYGTGNASEDICPSNWRMPTGGANGEYQHLFDQYNVTQSATDTRSLQYNLSTPLSGYFLDGTAHDRGSYGYFWSSTRGSGNSMYRLRVLSSGVNPQTSIYRDYGFSVRCLLRSS